VIPINHDGELVLDEYRRLLSEKTKLVSVTHVSNALGTIVPVKDIVRLAHERNVPVLLDGAQAVPHLKVDVQELACDFYAFSGHKLFGPTGVGILYGRSELLDAMPPYQGGGDMISLVTLRRPITTCSLISLKPEPAHRGGNWACGGDRLFSWIGLEASRGARA